MAIEFSPQQIQAIETTGANLLVSAAAGAGKTAVLVARILFLLGQSNREFDLQNLLVVTFTRAAAREMRDRIGEAIHRRLEQNPDDVYFQRQLALLDRAPISTLDSFCQELVRENFHSLGINPGFTVLDADEADLLWGETIEDIFESHYSDDSARGDEFRRLVDTYGGRREDQNLTAEVRRVADFLRTTADPDRWKRATLAALEPFEEAGGTALDPTDTPWGRAFRDSISERLLAVHERLHLALRLLISHGIDDAKLSSFIQSLVDAAETARSHLATNGLNKWALPLKDPINTRMPSAPRSLDEGLKETRARVKDELIAPARDELRGLFQFEGRYTAAEWVAGVHKTIPLVRRLFLLTDEVLNAFDREKRRLGALDFGDLERLAHRALQGDSADPQHPGVVAERYRDQFEHVLVDEYQDINELQDAILRLVSRQDDTRDRTPNLFAVGDVKQSIYGFRLADPDIFIQSYKSYDDLDARPGPAAAGSFRIDLPTNYRCRQPIVDSVNAIFQRLMADDLGGIPYDEPARLVCGRVVPKPASDLPPSRNPDLATSELILVEEKPGPKESEEEGDPNTSTAEPNRSPASEPDSAAPVDSHDPTEELSGGEREACALAERLWEIVGHAHDGSDAVLWVHAEHPDFPGRGPHSRPARWSDIVILLRAVSSRAESFIDALRRCGIPLVAPPAGGLLETLEVRDILSTLRTLDNPCQDIPLAGHLRSPLCRFSDDDLAKVRLFTDEGDFFSVVEQYAKEGPEPEIRERCNAALGRIASWRAIARESTIADLVDHILEETAYRDYVGSLPEGRRRQANLDALRSRAVQFDSFARRGLVRFLRFLDGLSEAGMDPSAGVALSPGENAVRVLSIHKSKGLEFPIVCVADLGHRFNMQDLYRAVVTDREWLIGMKTPAGRRSITLPSLSHEVVKEQRRRAMLAEELRLLYVAMTRAREHLILSASVRNVGDRLQEWSLWAEDPEDVLPAFLRMRAQSHLDWVGPALAGQSTVTTRAAGIDGDGTTSREGFPFLIRAIAEPRMPETIATGKPRPTPETGVEVSAQSNSNPGKEESPTALPPWHDIALASLDQILTPLPHRLPPGLRAKLSVTEIKRLWEYGHEPEDGGAGPTEIRAGRETAEGRYSLSGAENPQPAPGKPSLSPVERGTLTHLVLQHLDFARCDSPDAIAAQVDELERLGLVPPGTRKSVDLDALEWLFQTPVGERLRARPEAIRKELPFTALLPAAEVYRTLPQETRTTLLDEQVVVQGVIDCLLLEPDGLRVYDYKTDSVTGAALAERAAAYGAQLQLYARAASEIYNRPAREAALIFLHPREIRDVKLE